MVVSYQNPHAPITPMANDVAQNEDIDNEVNFNSKIQNCSFEKIISRRSLQLLLIKSIFGGMEQQCNKNKNMDRNIINNQKQQRKQQPP